MEYPFFVNNFDRVKNFRSNYPTVGKIFEHPISFWYGKKSIDIEHSVKRLLKRASPNLPVFVLYNIPNRDLGRYSSGGAFNNNSYLKFISDFCSGIEGASPIVIYEPDALAHVPQLPKVDADTRIHLMKDALEMLATQSSAIVYTDIGHSNWLDLATADKLLSAVNHAKTRGFALNVSNYRSTKESMNYGLKLCEVRDEHFVIDTSRNGKGPYGNEWCNPPGRALGRPASCNTGNEKCDAFLWVKVPGESDGKCNGGLKAGRFWPEMAEELVNNSRL